MLRPRARMARVDAGLLPPPRRFSHLCATALAPVELTPSEDGLVHFGAVVQLQSVSRPAVLSCDAHERQVRCWLGTPTQLPATAGGSAAPSPPTLQTHAW
jgi:hypothetical protein